MRKQRIRNFGDLAKVEKSENSIFDIRKKILLRAIDIIASVSINVS